MTTSEATSIRTGIDVEVPIERAFAVFTEQFDRIKPREHNLLTVEIAESVFEPHVGGSVYDRGIDGSICRWARVLDFDPPHRFVISWEIGTQWQLESDPSHVSEVEVTFTDAGEGRTHVELVHRQLDRHGEGWESLGSALVQGQGWPLYLDRYAALCTA